MKEKTELASSNVSPQSFPQTSIQNITSCISLYFNCNLQRLRTKNIVLTYDGYAISINIFNRSKASLHLQRKLYLTIVRNFTDAC